MDEGGGGDDEVARIDKDRGSPPFQTKDNNFIMTNEGRLVLDSREATVMRTHEGNCPESSAHLVRDGDDLNTPEQPAATNPRSFDGIGGMVQELTLRNFGSPNMGIVGMPSSGTTTTNTSMEGTQTTQNHWQHLYQLNSKVSHCQTVSTSSAQGVSSDREKTENISSPKFVAQNPSHDECRDKEISGNNLDDGAIRTKILSKSSGFSEFYIKNSLRGRGVVFRGPPRTPIRIGSGLLDGTKARGITVEASDAQANLGAKSAIPSSSSIAEPRPLSTHNGVPLREWLKFGRCNVNKCQRLNIFRQIVQLLDNAHAQGYVLQDLRPSSLRLLASDRVRYVGSPFLGENLESENNRELLRLGTYAHGKRTVEQGNFSSVASGKRQKFVGDINFQLSSRIDIRANTADDVSDEMEEKWYTSPEELTGREQTMASNIYSLGVLYFELLVEFRSGREHRSAMSNLRHRILPPSFLSEHPKEAGYCLWFLHPEPSSRPTTREILQSEVISGLQDVCAQNLTLSIEQDDAESEQLSHFLVLLKKEEQKNFSELGDNVRCLETDIQEIEKRRRCLIHSGTCSSSLGFSRNICTSGQPSNLEALPESCSISSDTKSRLMNNISQLENAYFSVRSKIQLSESNGNLRQDTDPLRNRENWCSAQNDEQDQTATDGLGAFFNGLCKYARYTNFKVRGVLRNGEFNNSANVVCSLGFDRDQDYFASAGVSKKIKVYEFNSLFNDSVDVHYPVLEMPNKSKLSCICWNNYIKSYLASTDYDGIVKVWDANTGQGFSEYTEHQRRAWSVDFSQVDPTKFASGSDDCSVKLWSINEEKCLATIKAIANVCCVQFSAYSSNLLAFGSADYSTYCYDIRNVRNPWCVLSGHEKAVSYVKFLDSETIVSASTDNSLKIWDLKKTNPNGPSKNACSLTLGGHTNEKNFVGLSVSDGYIACGSETNEVYAYYRSLPMPITSHKFGSIDPLSGKDTDDDDGLFVSSVCWKEKSDMVIAANSSGCIKVLQMVQD